MSERGFGVFRFEIRHFIEDLLRRESSGLSESSSSPSVGLQARAYARRDAHPQQQFGGHGIGLMVRLVRPLVLSPFVRQNLRRYLSVAYHEVLVVLKELVESGKLTPVIDKTYPLRKDPCAPRVYRRRTRPGNVVITV